MTATNTTFNKVAVLEDLMRQEPHNAAHYKEVQRVQKNQHIQVAIKLQHMLEADDEFRQAAGLPQLDLPEHLWTVRNMDTAPIREQHFMAISSEVEVLHQQLKVKGMYPVPPNYMQINQQNVLSAHSAGKTVSVATTGQVVFQSTAWHDDRVNRIAIRQYL